jgi:hypothetical protein
LTTKRQHTKKGGENRTMSGIENNIMPFVSTIGFGGIMGFLIGFMLKQIMKILAVIAGVFFAAKWCFVYNYNNSSYDKCNVNNKWRRDGVNSIYFRQKFYCSC